MTRAWLIGGGLALLLTGCARPEPVPDVQIPAPPAGVEDLNTFLEETRARHDLPGIAVAVFTSRGLRAIGTAGTRKVGTGVPLIYTDKLPVASIAKTMTATVIARLIEAGRLNWTTTLADAYPELVGTMRPEFRTATVEMLLQHAAGLPRWMRHDDIAAAWVRQHRELSNPDKRYAAVAFMLAQPSEYPPGTRHYYTNDAYLILGNIAERAAGKTCEELFREYIFEPLGMASFGFGEPWADGSLNQPWGHVQRGSRFVPYEPDSGRYGDPPFAIPYGGVVHGSVADLASYGTYHLRGDLGLETSLSSATFRRLHHAPPAEVPRATEVFATGFFNEGRVDAEGRWLNVQHWGYYARGRSLLWFSPQADVGVAVLTNGTDEDEARGMQPLSEIVGALFSRYRSDPGATRANTHPTARRLPVVRR
jgi:CubicO group peptidase (beta-lactamase class C family)